MLSNWLRVYWANTLSNKVYFVLTVLGLAVGIGAVTLSTLYYLEESSYDQWNPYKDDVYFVFSEGKINMAAAPFILAKTLQEDYPFVESVLPLSYYEEVEIIKGERLFTTPKLISSNDQFFNFFPYPLLYGEYDQLFATPSSIVLEAEFSAKIFGELHNPIGEELVIEDQVFTVSGVYTKGGQRSTFMPEVITGVLTDFIKKSEDWLEFRVGLMVRTKSPQALKVAIDDLMLEHIYAKIAKDKGVPVGEYMQDSKNLIFGVTRLIALRKIHLSNEKFPDSVPEARANSKVIYVVMGLSWLILVLSIFNYINLSLSKLASRTKEVGVRKTFGASTLDVLKQFFFETGCTVLVSFILSVYGVFAVLPFWNQFLQTSLTIDYSQVGPVLLLIFVLVVILSGGIPALYTSRLSVVSILKGDTLKGKSGVWIKNGLLVLQLAIASFFIVGVYTVYSQTKYMLQKDLGFRGDKVLSIPFLEEASWGKEKVQAYALFKEQLSKVKGIEQVSTSSLSFGANGSGGYLTTYPHKEERVMVTSVQVDFGYFEMLEVKLKEGRFLQPQFASDSIDNVLINEAMLVQLQEEKGVGLHVLGKQVIGVIKDVTFQGLDKSVNPQVYMYQTNLQGDFSTVVVKVNVAELATILPAIEKLWDTFHPQGKKGFSYQFLDEEFASVYNDILEQQRVLKVLTSLVVFIALFGLFAVSSFTMGTKLKEIAIRKVLGADSWRLLRQLSLQYVVYSFLGFGLAVYPSYYFLTLWLNNYAYRITIGWEVYMVCFLGLLILTLMIVISRAYRATQVDVLKYIKYE